MRSASELAYRRGATYRRSRIRRVLILIPEACLTAAAFGAVLWALVVLRALVAPAL